MRALELKVPPVVVVLIFGAAMRGIAWLAPFATFEVPGNRLASLSLILAGSAIAIAGVCAFRANQTTVDPRTPDAASTIVVGGVYRLSRNPMYLGFLIMLAGWAVGVSNALALLFLPLFVAYMNAFQIEPEERILHSKFGAKFAAYTASVRRWV
jgi:protein-S-isoprenylcysteine O-methyltransferase Ste14